MLKRTFVLGFFMTFAVGVVMADESGYRSRNPSFGGSPAYGSYFLQRAKEIDDKQEALKRRADKAVEDAFISAIRTKARDSYVGETKAITTIKLNGVEVEIDSTDPENITYTVY